MIIALSIAGFISLYSSNEPDSLERIAKDHGFMEKGGVQNLFAASSVERIAGTMLIFVLVLLIGFGLRKPTKKAGKTKTFLDSRIKIILALMFIISVVSTRIGDYTLLSVHALVLAFFLFLSFISAKKLFKRILAVLPFALIPAIGIPFAGNAGLEVFLTVIIKSILSVSCITILTETTSEQRIIQGFARLRMPGIFLLIISFLLRYYRLFSLEGEKMFAAMKSRGGGMGSVKDLLVSGNIIGNIFIRSYQRSERIYSAMASRGFDKEKTWNQYYR